MTTEDLMKLRELAEAANTTPEQRDSMRQSDFEVAYDAMRKFEKAMTPAKVIELLDALEALGREVAAEIELRGKAEQGLVDWSVKYANLEAELAAIRATQGQAASGFDVTIDDEPAKMLKAFLTSPLDGDDDPTPIRLLLGDGHSGYGLYLAAAEYPEEGAELLCSIASTTDKDAKRYRWWAGIVASGDFEPLEKAFEVFEHTEATTKEAIDAAIDAAMLAALPKLGGV